MPRTIEIAAMSNTQLFSRKDHAMKSGLFAASLVVTSLFMGAMLPSLSPAFAADGDAAAYEDQDQGRFVRIGLNKSVVVRLPAEARDVIVGNPGIVDAVVRTKNTAYLFARAVGQTNIFFFDANGQQILALDLEVAQDVTGLRKLINRTLPGNRITVDTVGTNVVLGGIARNALEVKTAMDLANTFAGSGVDKNTTINTMVVEGEDQVMLKVKVVEIQRRVLKQFGIDLSTLLSAGKFAFNLASVPVGAGALNPASGFKTSYAGGGLNFEGLIRAMEGDGLVRTLAEPNLTALTGQSAAFHAGGEFPVGTTCTGTSDSRSCATEFKEYGVNIGFSPTVLSEDRIVLNIKTNVSELGALSVGGVPSLNSRSAETVLEMPSGGSMMIAGLISESTRQNLDSTPGLKKLPILGTLFRSHDFQSEETELVVIVTPVLVRPTTQSKLKSPDKGFVPPSDKQAIFLGRLNKVYGGTADAPGGTYHGNVGFIVE
jgi:pilus assembly protein CpaC